MEACYCVSAMLAVAKSPEPLELEHGQAKGDNVVGSWPFGEDGGSGRSEGICLEGLIRFN